MKKYEGTIIEQSVLFEKGYKYTEWFDKDSFEDDFDNIKNVCFSKELGELFQIEIVFTYHADKPDYFQLVEHTAQLAHATGDVLPLPLDIDHIEKVFDILKVGL